MATTTTFGNMLNQKPAGDKKVEKKKTTPPAAKNLAELRALAEKKTKKKGKK